MIQIIPTGSWPAITPSEFGSNGYHDNYCPKYSIGLLLRYLSLSLHGNPVFPVLAWIQDVPYRHFEEWVLVMVGALEQQSLGMGFTAADICILQWTIELQIFKALIFWSLSEEGEKEAVGGFSWAFDNSSFPSVRFYENIPKGVDREGWTRGGIQPQLGSGFSINNHATDLGTDPNATETLRNIHPHVGR